MVINVAIFGSIIPTPLATPTTRAVDPAITASAVLCTVSVVIIPRATSSVEVSSKTCGIAAKPVRTLFIGY
ncbi:unannotated protein [freshwater metagenome]|uniref:Unannotated protein n=1 Tax=freshwater metagenome TaxID=449393 RepID=A0A6J6GTN2_9ZZZZ